jgi:CubicO group peptidase (beta-lactamase class C family)
MILHWKNSFRISILLLIVILFTTCSYNTSGDEQSSYSYNEPEQLGDGWETGSLADVGMDQYLLEELINGIQSNDYNEIHSILIVKDGKLVFEEYFPGHDFRYSGENFHGALIDFDHTTPHNTHSATKSVTSALIGIAVDKGYIGGVDDRIFMYFQPYSYLQDEDKDKISIEHLLTMTSGFEWNEWDVAISGSDHDIVQLTSSSDPVRYVLEKPVVDEPGTNFYYNGGGVELLGEIIRITSGRRLDAFSGEYLFGPMGITNFEWQLLGPNHVFASGDIYIRPRVMAKFGYLFLNDGIWNGDRIISENWVRDSIREHVQLPQVDWADGYGYLWWLKTYYTQDNQSYDSYFAEGWGGQKITVFPDEDMVVVFTGANYTSHPPCDEILVNYILPALQ